MSALSLDFTNQIALITGGTRGIGRTTAQLLAEAGATLIVTGTSKNSLDAVQDYFQKEGVPGNHYYFAVDFSNETSTNQFLNELIAFDRIDICINNAGINIIKPLQETTDADYDRLLTINMKVPYQITRVVAEIMKKNNYGRIVNISSIWGVITKPKRSLYTTSKHALLGFTKTVAVEYAPHNVCVNAVSPGFTLTELTRDSLSDKEMADLSMQIPAQKMAETKDIAYAIIYLASKLNTYLTGQNLTVDGGFTII